MPPLHCSAILSPYRTPISAKDRGRWVLHPYSEKKTYKVISKNYGQFLFCTALTWNRRLVKTVNQLLVTTCAPIRTVAPLIGIEPIKVGSTIVIVTTTEVSMHRHPERVVAGRVPDGDSPVGMVSDILFKISYDRLPLLVPCIYIPDWWWKSYPHVGWTCFRRPDIIHHFVPCKK